VTDDKPDLERTLLHYDVVVTGLHGNRLVCCPVHDERIPSCSVNLDKQLMFCHACDFKGDSINLIMEKENCDYRSAIEFAKAHLGWAGETASHRGRVGLSGTAGPARGGYVPRLRRRARLSGA